MVTVRVNSIEDSTLLMPGAPKTSNGSLRVMYLHTKRIKETQNLDVMTYHQEFIMLSLI